MLTASSLRDVIIRLSLQWLAIPFALTHDAVTSLSDTAFDGSNWVGDENLGRNWWSGNYIDSSLLLIFGGIPWQVRTPHAKNRTQMTSHFSSLFRLTFKEFCLSEIQSKLLFFPSWLDLVVYSWLFPL